MQGELGRIWVGEMGKDMRAVGHCKVLDGMGDWVGWREAGWVDYVVVIPGCETSCSLWMEVHFSNIHRTLWGSFASVSGGIGSC